MISRLRQRILEVGEPQYMVAARAGMSPSRLSEYCLMQRDIPTKHLVALCEVLECEPESLVGRADIRVAIE